MTPHQRKIAAIVARLLEWFPKNARDLPWRRTLDPYAIWVSEIMLQQTQVKTVTPYWERWMRRLPNICALAKAKPEKVLKLWEGLGYYSRARNLQKAAKLVAAQHGGKLPQDFEAILALAGIGRYTAGAICSIAFNQPVPILDGNVIRVLTRLFGIEGNPREKAVNTQLWSLASNLVSLSSVARSNGERNCSHLNQALMELGALVCTPVQPKCAVCPVRARCITRRTGKVECIPRLDCRTPATARRFVAFVVEKRGRFFVRQRPADAVNAHFWEFPNMEMTGVEMSLERAARNTFGKTLNGLQLLGTFKHTITRYRITLEAYAAELQQGDAGTDVRGKWLNPAELMSLPVVNAHRRILACLGSAQTQARTSRSQGVPRR